MALVVENVLQTNLTLAGVKLVNTQEERDAFRKAVDTEVVTSETGLMGSDEIVERIHNLSRDRIVVVSNPERTVILREYPEESSLLRLAQVAAMAIENTNLDGQELRAFGYNVELICESESKELAFQYLADHLFTPYILKDEESLLIGGAGRLIFEKLGLRWQARLEPRFNDENTTKVFVGLNIHHAEPDQDFPTEDEVSNSLTLIWSEVHDLLKRLDAGSM